MCRILIFETIVVYIWAGKYSRCVVRCHEAISSLYLTISDFLSVQFLWEQLKIQGSHTFLNLTLKDAIMVKKIFIIPILV